ncbi:PrsW family intramembrane metalloprotease [Jiangella alkaliphila]|uniref:Membrane proteinase PrsW, cleaves anti-sigma factor RsiW, M82 family n=1 Tax=Jiangella alkaliphila TaxID=419479 RepID=A0A1H2L5R6_9ACTN|nr:PrsW family intramembrane metalloprotease [Jiangella alkaliphila]SDU76174.1 Membrane proteinase PrsW, cleaves anti-sigma factor RsiW, M82 family [Jiangella alkaliphila]
MTGPVSRAPAQHQPWSRQQRRRVLWPVLGLVAAAGSAVVVLGLAVGDLAPSTVAVATLFALLPVVVVVGAFLWLDRWEPEPGRTMLAAFLWGGGVATLGALLVNSLVAVTYGEYTSSVVSAPFVEEALKGAFLVGLLWWWRDELDGLVDGIVYAGLVAAGFAFVENILYLGRAFDTASIDGYTVFVVRGIFSPFAHPLFTVFIGIAVGIAAQRHSTRARVVLPLVGYLLAAGLHALWNASALWDDGQGFVAVYVVVMVPLFAAMLSTALWQRRREQRVVAERLGEFVQAGWIPWYEVDLLTTMRSRHRWTAAMKSQYGRDAARAVRAYQGAVTELAFLVTRLRHAGADVQSDPRLAEVLAGVSETRARAVALTSAGQ